MATNTKIEWTDASWNPIVGCTKVSAGCDNCYAIRMAWRHQHNPKTGANYHDTARKMANGELNWTGKINLLEDVLQQPYKWKKPKRIFVNSMSDLFQEDVPFAFMRKVMAVIHDNPHHTFQILTKRPARMQHFFHWFNNSDLAANFPNLWLGVSVEDQKTADERIPILLQIPGKIRFLSCEPLLGKINLTHITLPLDHAATKLNALTGEQTDMGRPWHDTNKIDWVIVGGESGPGARPMHPQWARMILDQCKKSGIPFFFKQNGEYISAFQIDDEANLPMEKWVWMAEDGDYRRGFTVLDDKKHYSLLGHVGKKAAGHYLDCCTHDEFPTV